MPRRGSFLRSSCAQDWCATQVMIAETSRPSKLRAVDLDGAAEEPKPRGSQVTTLKPAARSGPSVESLGLVSPAEPHPGPTSTVGARWPAFRPAAVKKLTWIVCAVKRGDGGGLGARGAGMAQDGAERERDGQRAGAPNQRHGGDLSYPWRWVARQ